MQTDNRFLDDLAKLATGAAGAAQGVRQEIETLIRQRVERVIYELDLVPREEFDAVKDMARKAREENAELKQRVEALEKEVEESTAKRRSTSRKTSAASGQKTAQGKTGQGKTGQPSGGKGRSTSSRSGGGSGQGQ